MKKIITAINNPKLNEELKKEKNFEVVGKDIQYKEAVLEILEKNKEINLLIISEKIPGDINLEILIKKIKIINEKIKIIFILEKENNELEKILINNKIIDIYYNNKINLKELIKIINKNEINMEEEIIELKKIIAENNKKKYSKKIKLKKIFFHNLKNIKEFNLLKNKKNFIKVKVFNKLKKHFLGKINKRNSFSKKKKMVIRLKNTTEKKPKIVTVSGNYKSGKTTIALLLCNTISNKNKNVLLIDGDFEKKDLSFILEKELKKYKNNECFNNKKIIIKNKIFKDKNNKLKTVINKKRKNIKNFTLKKIKLKKSKNKLKKIYINKKNKIINYKIKKLTKLKIKKLDKNLNFFGEMKNIFSKKENENNIENKINYFLKIIYNNYDFIIFDLSKNNFALINKSIIEKSSVNFLVTEPEILGIKEIQKLQKKYIFNWKIPQESIHIVCNKKKSFSMNKFLIYKILKCRNKILEINESKVYHFCTNFFVKKIFLDKNRIIKKEIGKLIEILKV